MKKLLVLVFMFCALGAQAGIDYGLDKGSTRIGFYGGASTYAEKWDNGVDEFYPGDTGFKFGGEMLMNVTPVFAVGMDIGYANYGWEKFNGGVSEIKSQMFHADVIGRINFMPSSAARFYIPFGGGASWYKAEERGLLSGDEDQLTFNVFGGAGVEFDLNPVLTVGLEGRLMYTALDDDKFAEDRVITGDILFKVGFRF
ncbi:Outer membrane protein beta-barrel domain-containing protein [Parelusimicrobium proximum]|uniref:outer membrane beta-barrel protein n=1 Tax=Parelusimicrobium proximum TaxID=3228953 RepID=UPI003D165C95